MPDTLSIAPPGQSFGAREERFVEKAFRNQYNLILLVGALLFSLALASVVPLALALLAEIAWLGIGARTPLFRNWVIRRAFLERRAVLEGELETVLTSLQPAYRTRFVSLTRATEEIGQLLFGQLGVGGAELDSTTLKLDEVRAAFLRLAAVHQRLSRFDAETPSHELEAEVLRIRHLFAAEKDLGVRVSLRQSLLLAERRREQRQQVGNTCRGVEVQLANLEKSLAYIKAEAASVSAPEVLRDIEALRSQASSSRAVEAETQEATRRPSLPG